MDRNQKWLRSSIDLVSTRQNVRLFLAALSVGESAALPIAMILLRSHLHGVRHAFHLLKSHHLALAACALIILSGVILVDLSSIVLIKASVTNGKNAVSVSERRAPGFIDQDRSSRALVECRESLCQFPAFSLGDEISRVTEINHWVRTRQSEDAGMWRPPFLDQDNPLQLPKQQAVGVPGACRRFSFILLGVLLSSGFDARIVCFASGLRRRGTRHHVAVEVWIEDLRKWVLLDPTYDCLITFLGIPLSATELCDLVSQGKREGIGFPRKEVALKPTATIDFYMNCCRHCFIGMSNAVFDGYSSSVGLKADCFCALQPNNHLPHDSQGNPDLVGCCDFISQLANRDVFTPLAAVGTGVTV